MSFLFSLGLFACQLLLTYPLISLTSSLWYGVKHGTVYVYKWAYPPEIKDGDPKYQVISKKDLSELDEDTRNKIIETYGEDIMIISAKTS